MRIREPFAQERLSEINLYKTKYFIVSEGQITEPRYFEKLNQSVISKNVTIINILRDYERSGNSNPGYLIKLLQEFLDNVESFIIVNELKHKISNWDHENPGKIDLNMIYHDLDNFYESNNYRIPYGDLEELFVKLFKNDIYEEIAVNFSLYFRTQDFTYSPITDSLNLVVDRDKDSFTEEQYDAVANFCNRNNVDLYVSNPCFEFWLYLHFIEVEQENKEMLLKNPRVSGSKRYIEKRLYDLCRYTKTSFSFKAFEDNIENAILREKNYEEHVSKLKNNLGSNVGILVNKIIKTKYKK